ncbi:MAG TPA: septal ring lytic transglycosylase RlpA family protein [Methylomirabilota bacterium]|nr:septal ring lytic transglycosylase RlpA family protein [Methylomirabilota bacterium]
MKALLKTQSLEIVAILVTLVMMSGLGVAAAQTEEGIAHHYSDKFEGKKTASGEMYDKSKLTAAHKKLDFGTKVKVTNVENKKSVVVTVNDRMGASSKAVIDVTPRAAEELGFKGGQAKVKLEVQK